MLTEHLFARGETFPSWMANALQDFLSVGAFGFVLSVLDTTHVQVVAGANDLAAAVAVHGAWRWNEATVSRAHPGGAAGTYDIFVTAKADSIVSTPLPYTDATDRSFQLAIVAAGATPTIVAGTVDIYRKIGSCQWDGTQIIAVTQTVPAAARGAALGAPWRSARQGALTIPSNVWTQVSMDTSYLLGDSQGGSIDVYTAPAYGWYLCMGQIEVPANTGGNYVQAGLMAKDPGAPSYGLVRQGSKVAVSHASPPDTIASSFATIRHCQTGSKISLAALTDCGALSVDVTNTHNYFDVMRIS